MDFIAANWLPVLIAVVILAVLAFWAFGRSSNGKIGDARDSATLTPPPPAAAPRVPPPAPKMETAPPPVATPTPAQHHQDNVGFSHAIEDVADEIAAIVSTESEASTHFEELRAEAAGMPDIPQSEGAPDDLTWMKGVGPKLNVLLNTIGVHRYDQIAAWGPKEIAAVDAHLGSFKGRIERDAWIDQASYLARGDTAGFEAKYGKL